MIQEIGWHTFAALVMYCACLHGLGNSGEAFDSDTSEWSTTVDSAIEPTTYGALAADWAKIGCRNGKNGCVVGGCCRTTPAHIAAVVEACELPSWVRCKYG
eukprot:SAG31_NODE_11_length_38734_cov_21.263854_23_plen_101_part_00